MFIYLSASTKRKLFCKTELSLPTRFNFNQPEVIHTSNLMTITPSAPIRKITFFTYWGFKKSTFVSQLRATLQNRSLEFTLTVGWCGYVQDLGRWLSYRGGLRGRCGLTWLRPRLLTVVLKLNPVNDQLHLRTFPLRTTLRFSKQTSVAQVWLLNLNTKEIMIPA